MTYQSNSHERLIVPGENTHLFCSYFLICPPIAVNASQGPKGPSTKCPCPHGKTSPPRGDSVSSMPGCVGRNMKEMCPIIAISE